MTLRKVATTVALLVIAASGGAVASARTPPPAVAAAADGDRPNLVVVLVDDMRTDELRFMDQTRRLLGERGVRFRRAISPHPLCCPARASLLTGQYAQNNGVRHNDGRYGGYRALRDRDSTLGAWLQDGGYQTAYVGKFLNRYAGTGPAEPGWDRWQATLPPTMAYTSYQFHGGEPRRGYITDAISRRSTDAIEAMAGRPPFFLFVSHAAPHIQQVPGRRDAPPVVARKYRDWPVPTRRLRFLDDPAFNEASVADLPAGMRQSRVERRAVIREARARARSLRSVDDAVGRLVRTLRTTGELDNTWIVFASDNGYLLGEHRLRHKNQLVRQALDVPLLISGPGVVRAGRSDRRIVSLVDLPATLLDLAGVPAGREQDGVSLMPLLQGQSVRWRDTTLVQTGRTGLRGEEPGWRYRGVQTGRYLFATDVATDRRGDLLFDRRRDPHELRNVVGDPRYAPVVAELRRRVTALEDCTGAACNRRWGPLPAPRR